MATDRERVRWNMTKVACDLVRANAFLVLRERQRNLSLRLVRKRPDDQLVAELAEVVDGLERLARGPMGARLDPGLVGGSLAEATEALAQSHRATGRTRRALELLAVAQDRYAAAGRPADAERIANASFDLRLTVDGGLTNELARLRRSLSRTAGGTLERAIVLVQLGEVRSRAGDDEGALEALDEASAILDQPAHRLPDQRMLLQALDESLEALSAADGPLDHTSAIEKATALRELHRRLYAAISRAAQILAPAKARRSAELAARIAQPLDVAPSPRAPHG